MNKTILKFAYCAAAVTLFTACSSEEDFFDQAKKDRLDFGTDVASEIPVVIGTGTTQASAEIEINSDESSQNSVASTIASKAPIYSNESTKAFTIKDEKVGIFMLAKGIIPDNDYSDLTWDNVNWANQGKTVTIPNIGSYVDKWSAPIWNQSANVTMYDASGTETEVIADGKTSSIDFLNTQPYYPAGNYCSYSLYGYYPKQSLTEQNTTVSKSKLSIKIPITGKEDILWGRASYSQEDVKDTDIKWFTPGEATGITYNGQEITDFTKYGYSAKFFRFSPFRTPDTDEALAPTMKFRHKMMMLKFDVIAGGTPINYDASDQNYERAYKTTVSGIAIDNAPKNVDLVVADLSGAANEGILTASTAEDNVQSIVIDGSATPEKGDDGMPKRVSVKGSDGEDAYIILPAIASMTYNLNLTLTDNNTSPATSQTLAVPLSLKTKNNFEEGKIYRVVLKIWNLEPLKLEATLDNWEEIEPTEENWNKYPFVTDSDHTIPVH